MAKKTKEIVEEQMPDMEIVEIPLSAPDSVRREVKPGPSMADLRKKYLGEEVDENEVDEAVAPEAASADVGDVEVSTVRPKRSPADPADDPGPRTVIISKKRGMLGSQG